MKPKTIVLMVVAIICGLGASYMTTRLLAERDQPQEPEQVKVPVLIAKKSLDMGIGIKNPEELFSEKQILREDVQKDAITDLKTLKGKYLKRGLRKGDQVTLDDLVDNSGLGPQLSDGMRAVGIRVSPESIAGGFASLPGSKVDVLWSSRLGGEQDNTPFCMTLIEDVMVLAADDRSRRTDEGTAMVANVVTLALTEEQSKRLTLCKDHGTLSLALRKHGDPGRVGQDNRVSLKDILKKDTRDRKTTRTTEDDPDKTPTPTVPEVKIPTVPTTNPPEKKRYFHTITFRSGDRQWKEVIETDEDGNVITDDIQRPAPDSPAAIQAPVNRQPGAQPLEPPKND